VEKEGTEVQINAKAVIIATGGYGSNAEWIKKYTGFDLNVNLLPVGNFNKRGDGIQMAWEAGAAEEGMGVLQLFRIGPLGAGIRRLGHLECATVQPGLWVDARGERFCNEEVAFNDTFQGNAMARLKEGYSYTILDDTNKQYLMEYGIDKNVSYQNLPGTRLTGFDDEMKEALQAGNHEVFSADSVEGLASQMGVDPVSLKATVEEYNHFCETGHDKLFAKNPQYLRAFTGPKFYAFKAHTHFMGSIGGIKINHRMEALDKDDQPIPGLYAAGSDAGGLYGDSYNFRDATGTTLGFAVTSGRVAGQGAVGRVEK
jgi:fumarate reductase flavoprotein subunit